VKLAATNTLSTWLSDFCSAAHLKYEGNGSKRGKWRQIPKITQKKKETLAKYSWNEFQKVEGGEESENAKINIGKEEKVC